MAGIKVTIDLDESQAIQALKSLNQQLGKTEEAVTKTSKKFDSAVGSFIGNLGAIAAVKAFDFLRAQVLESFDTFSQFEQGLIDVAKTANLTTEEVNDLSKNILQLSREIPATTKELNEIAAAAGQLGVKGTKNLTIFTETVAKLGRVSNLSGEEAATTLTRILNVSRENIDTIDTFASVIVSLGNNFAASESEIASMTNEVARATSNFGVSSAEAAALSATLRSVGVRAEEAGGVMTKAFIGIDQAIRTGGKSMQRLSEITGMSGEQIKKQFGEDAIGFFRNFVAGLDRMQKSGGDMTSALNGLNISGIRVNKLFPVLAKNTGEFDRALGLAYSEVSNATALNNEFETSLESTASKTKLLENAVERARIRIGEKLAGAFEKVAPYITDFVDMLGKSDIEVFADATEDVGKLNKEIETLNAQIAAAKDSPLPDFLLVDPTEQAEKIKVLKDRVAELNGEAASSAISNLKTELQSLSNDAAKSDPLLLSLYGTPEAIEARKAKILETLKNMEMQAILEGQQIISDGEDAKTQTILTKLEERKTFLDELALVQAEEDASRKAEEALADEYEKEASFQRLSEALGREEAAKELYRIKSIKSEGERRKALKKLGDKMDAAELKNAEEKRKKEEEFNRLKVQNQRETLATIASLTQTNSGVLFNIGKAAAVAQASINVSEGVTKALSAFPPPFNFAAAAAVGAAGAVQIANIAGQKRPDAGRFEEGGIVGGNSFTGDRLNANVNSGEMILNRRQQGNLFTAINDGTASGGGGANVTINNPVLLEEGSVDTLIDQINDALEFRNKELRTA